MEPRLLLRLPESPEQRVDWLLWQLPSEPRSKDASVVNIDDTINVLGGGFWDSVEAFVEGFTSTTIESEGDIIQPLSAFSATVLVPASAVTLHSLELEGRLTPAVRKSLIWRLEDEISEDGENFHLSVLATEKQLIHVALISQDVMAQWQLWLQEAGVNYKCWCPDALTLPWVEQECTLAVFDQLVLARYGQWQIGACDLDWRPMFEQSIRQTLPDIALNDLTLQGESLAGSPLLPFLAIAAKTRINLLQGEWLLPSPWKQYLRPLMPATIMMLVLLGLMMTNQLFTISQLDSQAQAMQQQANNTYQQLFPGERIVNLQAQMRQKLAALQPTEKSGITMPTMLSHIAPVLQAMPELQTKAMSFDGNKSSLHILVEANSFEFFSRFRERFQQEMDSTSTPLTLNIGALEKVGNKVRGQLVIAGAAS